MLQADLLELAEEALKYSCPDWQGACELQQIESDVYLLRESFHGKRFCLKVRQFLHAEMLSLLALRAHFRLLEPNILGNRIVPRVYCVLEKGSLEVMLLEYLEEQGLELEFSGAAGLGQLLSKLHTGLALENVFKHEEDLIGSPMYSSLFRDFCSGAYSGFYCDNFIGLTPQKNGIDKKYTAMQWPEFFAELRLLPMMERCEALLQKKDIRSIETLCARLGDILPRLERASLLHGDLWAGNVYWCGAEPVFIDPACYYGHYEVDLAMTQMFSGFSTTFYDSYYTESGPAEPGAAERFSIYNLYHWLNHLLLFGSSYYSGVRNAIKAWG